MFMLSNLTFMQPIILFGLLSLPLLWYILRVTPPPPKTLFFPATRFLTGLSAEEQTPSQSPWWLLLLRLIMAGLVIIALARPVINAADKIPGHGDLRLIVDNSWAGAQLWDQIQNAGQELINQAAREGRDIYILPTTTLSGSENLQQYGPLIGADALSILRGLSPNSWPSDYAKIIHTLQSAEKGTSIHSVWLSHGLDEQTQAGKRQKLVKLLQNHGGLNYVSPDNALLPLLLRPATKVLKAEDIEKHGDIRISVDAPPSLKESLHALIQVHGEKNILDAQSIVLSPSSLSEQVFFDVPDALKNNITKFKISSRKGAGAIHILDDQSKKRSVGIVTPTNESNTAPLIEAAFYIKRALEPYATLQSGDLPTLLQSAPSVIILPDIAAMPSETLNQLEQWVQDGGLLLRFAGPNMAKSRTQQFLLPVHLRSGERSLSGTLSWDDPQKIAPFSENSPFFGLEPPQDIRIKQQILADPAQDLDGKVWARLTDGTPLITANNKERGLIVFIHTSANADWSDFALSGLYVSILKRITQMAGNIQNTANTQNFTTLDPLLVMDGYGNLISPKAYIKPIAPADLHTLIPSAQHPPGLYGNGSTTFALNLGTNLPALSPMKNLPISVMKSHYDDQYEFSFMPHLLYAALILFCIDWFLMIFIVGNGRSILRLRMTKAIMITSIIGVSCLSSAYAQTAQNDVKYAKGFHLAYIKTGDRTLDRQTHNGLENLAQILMMRTSVEPEGVVGINPEKDTMSFFPVIYWAISPHQREPSDTAIRNIQSYLDHGGTIIFDTRDKNRSQTAMNNTENAKALRMVTASLNIPPLSPIPEDHVLSRAFYLLDGYPGRYKDGTLWIEQLSASGRDNVSSVLIGSNDWAGSWADAQIARNAYNANATQRQQEYAFRFGVNLVMYALTGNYKADQVHIPHILERLHQ